MPRFDKEILNLAEQLFADGEIETLLRRESLDQLGYSPGDTAVRLVHLPSGMEVTCDDFDSQICNKAAGLLRLYHQLYNPA